MSPRIMAVSLHCSIALVIGCGNGAGQVCTRDDECASQFCKADGTCGPAPADSGTDGAIGDGQSGACTPNHDGQIASSELPLIAGRMATFRVATNATWNTAGQANVDGSRHWTLVPALAGDADHVVTLTTPNGAWWHADFAAATYATTLSSTSDLVGVFAVDATGVALLGVVSPAGGATKTELAYDPPARILAVPFGAGSTWTSTSTVSGTAQGAIVAYTETYRSLVDQHGTMTTPYGDFPVVRVATDLTRTEGLATLLTNRTFAWVAECFGSVASATSKDFASGAEFSDTSEVRRLAP